MATPAIIRDLLNASIYKGSLSPVYIEQINIITALLALALLLNLISLCIRYKRSPFWLVRMETTPNGKRFIHPHATLCYIVCTSVFLCIGVPFVRLHEQWVVVGSNLTGMIAVSSLSLSLVLPLLSFL